MAGERVDVLAVDDNPTNLLSLEAVLQDLGANLVKAHSGDEALLRVLQQDFALVLLDIHMPGLDGFETARLIRSRERSRHLPLIFLTAFDRDSEQVEMGYELGAVDFLFKPIVPTILKSKVAVFLDLHRKTTEVLRQANLLQEAARREHGRSLAEARARWERERLQANNERLQGLVILANRLLSESDPEVFVPAVGQELIERLGLDVGWVDLRQSDGNIQTVWSTGLPADLPDHRPLVEEVGRRRTPVVLQHLPFDEDPAGDTARSLHLLSCVGLPLMAARRFLGVLGMGSRTRAEISGDEMAVLQVAADQLALAIDRIELVRKLEQSAADLRAADRRKDEFLAMLAHELRNPLAPIVNAFGFVRHRAADGDPTLRSIAAAERQALHMARLVDDLLDVSRITRGKIELRREVQPFRQVIDHALQAVLPLVESRGHELALDLPDEDLLVDVDGTRLAQIASNLLANAAKYTDSGGHLRLAASVHGDDLVLEVEDDGAGIHREMLEQIFDTFVQIDPSADRSWGGLGIGLTLVKSLVELHGGTVRAESEGLGLGSRFVVRLPVVVADVIPVPAVPQECPAPAEPADQERRPRRVLLVEDNEDIRLTLRDLLEFEGHEVSEAADGTAGAELILQSLPNVALVDIGLPGIDGYEVAQRVRSEPGGNQVRLVALTGYGGDDVARRAREAGFDAHLIKPVKIEELFRLIGETD